MPITRDFNRFFNPAGRYDIRTPEGNTFNAEVETHDPAEFLQWIEAMDARFGAGNWDLGPAGTMRAVWEPGTAAGSTPAPAQAVPAAGSDPSGITNVLNRHRAGVFGTVGSANARDRTIFEMARVWESMGLSNVEAITQATQRFDREFRTVPTVGVTNVGGLPPGAGIRSGIPAGTPAGAPAGGRLGTPAGVQPGVSEQERLAGAFGSIDAAQQAQFRDFINQIRPSSQFGAPVRASLLRGFEPISTQFQLEQGLGRLGPESEAPEANPFADFLERSGGRRPTGTTLRGLVGEASNLLAGPDITDELDPRRGFQEALREDLDLQRDLAFQSFLPSQPLAFRPSAQRAAQRAFDAWRLRNTSGEQFLPGFVRRGFSF